jgi:hypothetical protein
MAAQNLGGRRQAEFDLLEEDSTWGKALARYRKQGMDEMEIDKYRQDFANKQRAKVKSLASKSKRK